MGNKKKLINKGLVELFPSNINMFIDLFAGSSIVSMNVVANKYIINDIDKHLIDLYSLFHLFSSEQIIKHIENRINQFGLAKERTKRNKFKDEYKLAEYKKAYVEFRNYFNNQPYNQRSVLDFYTLIFYSFSQQYRFNSKGEFNMPVGNDCFSEQNKEYIEMGCNYFKQDNVYCFNKDFRELNIKKVKENDFVYLDPPYFNTTATYTENGGWTEKDESDLLRLCESLESNNVKFGSSNVFKCKGKSNEHLVKWCEECNWKVYTFNKFTYMACGKGNADAQEVYICNYL